MLRSLVSGALALGLGVGVPSLASALVIDNFSNTQDESIFGGASNPVVEMDGEAAGGAIGGNRSVVLTRTAGFGSAIFDVNTSVANALSVSTGAGVVANALVIYDGNDDFMLDTSGLDVDVTEGGTNSVLRLLVEADQSDVVIRVTFHQGANESFADLITTGDNTFGSGQVLTADFSALTAGGGGPADLTHVGAITLEIFGPTAFDVSLKQFESAVPEPVSLVLVSLGLVGLRHAGRRRPAA